MAKANITVIGSMNVDHFMITDRLPDRGECFIANSYRKALGGKGGNVAIAIHRGCHRRPTDGSDTAAGFYGDELDISVRLIGAVGNDDAGSLYKKTLEDNGLDTSGVRMVDGVPTGTCFAIIEEDSRDNRLLGVLGANLTFSADSFARVEDLGTGVPPDLVVAQLEINMEAIEQMLVTAGKAEIDVLMNPSPANHILLELYRFITHFVVNETEAAIYSGLDVGEVQESNWHDIAKAFLAEGVKNVVITLGAAGAFYANERSSGHVPAFTVIPKDVTGAG